MASWKQNKVVGIVAGVVIILAAALIIGRAVAGRRREAEDRVPPPAFEDLFPEGTEAPAVPLE